MANQFLQVSANDLYATGYQVELPDGRLLLKRNKIVYSPTASKDTTHIVTDNDRIWDVAFRYYKDDKSWGIIADANRIYNPFELEVGTELVVPDFEQTKLQFI